MPCFALNQETNSIRAWLRTNAAICWMNAGSSIPHSPHSAIAYGLFGCKR